MKKLCNFINSEKKRQMSRDCINWNSSLLIKIWGEINNSISTRLLIVFSNRENIISNFMTSHKYILRWNSKWNELIIIPLDIFVYHFIDIKLSQTRCFIRIYAYGEINIRSKFEKKDVHILRNSFRFYSLIKY